MTLFNFSYKVKEMIKEKLNSAEIFINIAVFQIHSDDIFKILLEKVRNNIKVEIFTLSHDSIHDNREKIVKKFEILIENGANIYQCNWNVGDPGRTTTAVGRWYSFHGKFIVTDKCAIAMTANFTNNTELDAILVYENDQRRIEEFKNKFQLLKVLFINKNGDYDGIIHQKIMKTRKENIKDVFELPKSIKTKMYEKHWIQHYPDVICGEVTDIKDDLYVTPFDCKGRELIMSVILKAANYVYISTESFTDPEFFEFLKKISLKNLKIKVLTGVKSMDFTDRIQNMFRELLAHNIELKTREDDLHAKLIITDKHVLLSSINLNKISLGFSPKKDYWRENTETIVINSEPSVLDSAPKQFISVFNESIEIKDKLEERLGKILTQKLRYEFEIGSFKMGVKSKFAQIVFMNEIKNKKFILEIGKSISEVAELFNKTQINMNLFHIAIILFLINDKKVSYEGIEKKINKLKLEIDLDKNLEELIRKNIIQKKDNYFYRTKFSKLDKF